MSRVKYEVVHWNPFYGRWEEGSRFAEENGPWPKAEALRRASTRLSGMRTGKVRVQTRTPDPSGHGVTIEVVGEWERLRDGRIIRRLPIPKRGLPKPILDGVLR